MEDYMIWEVELYLVLQICEPQSPRSFMNEHVSQVRHLQQVYVLETGKLSEYDGELEQLVKTNGQVAFTQVVGTDGFLKFLEKERDEYNNYRYRICSTLHYFKFGFTLLTKLGDSQLTTTCVKRVRRNLAQNH